MTPLGMTAQEEQVYRHLAANPHTSMETLVGQLGDEAADAVERLRGLGLVAGDPLDVRRPDQAFQRLVREKEASLFAAKARVAELQELYDLAHRPASTGPVTLLTSRVQLKTCMDDLELNAVRTLDKFITAPFVRLTTVHAPDDDARRDDDGTIRTPHLRVIYEQAVVDDDRALDGIRNDMALPNAEIRIAASFPYKLIIADGERALVPAYPRDAADRLSTYLITGGTELIAHQMVFEQCWAEATPLVGGNDVLSEEFSLEERHIIGLLVSGATNERIARITDLGVRTVQRRLADLQERAGVRSRNELIRHAATRWMN
ncbi:helix-turn-helix transcriptional regulator [Nonomuraea sp. SYSU D8015]|uniref:helix-turn-helix transcriptional regulator n=1 Tax=Nonomuraea sp. SYSU D8015 TaxID=2593644 RepID=UPI0016610BB5|nr:helix-turn-helix transcriptional regulator [Nonomuraea sp. SYSU D8015]